MQKDEKQKEKKPALANGESLPAHYPEGIQWDIGIPHVDLVRVIDESIVKFGSRPCVDFLGKKFTYTEIGNLISRAAAGLQDMGVGKGTKVGLYMPNTTFYPVMFFAALRVGATVVNYSPLYTTEELAAQIKDSGTEIMVTIDKHDFFDKAETLQKSGALKHIIKCQMGDALPYMKAKAYRIKETYDKAKADKPDMTNWQMGNLMMRKACKWPCSNQETQEIRPLKDDKPAIVDFRDIIDNNGYFHSVAIDPDEVAVLQYTGGTTGIPKGAMLTHFNLVANLFQTAEFYGESPNKPKDSSYVRNGKERTLAAIPYFHVFGMTVAMLTAMKTGTEIIILPNPRDMEMTIDAINKKKPTFFPSVPKQQQGIAENKNAKKADLSSLKAVISGGAALPSGVHKDFEDAVGTEGVVKQGYGMTESSPVISCNPPHGKNKPESVGMPYPKTTVKIADPDNPEKIMKIGELGEICVQGPQVMKGYYNQPEATGEMIKNGWLHTGDLGYLDDDMYLHIVDRKKRLVIINGFNVYPAQVENAIANHPDIAECVVVSVPDDRSGESAKAFIRFKAGVTNPPDIAELKKFLEPHINRMETPKHFEFVEEELPKTAVGKPDWKTLQDEERRKYEQSKKQNPDNNKPNMK